MKTFCVFLVHIKGFLLKIIKIMLTLNKVNVEFIPYLQTLRI